MAGKKARIALVIPPVTYARQPSIGIAYLAAYLTDKGHEVKVFDLNLSLPIVINDGDDTFWGLKENSEKFFDAFREHYERWVQDIAGCGADIVGFQVWHTSEYSSLRLAEMIKSLSPETSIVFGGFLANIRSGEYMDLSFVDAVVLGEGEETIAELAERVAGRKSGGAIPGCMIKTSGKVLDGGLRPEMEDLDILPFPDFSFFNMDKYAFPGYMPISFGRGCRWKCAFCNVFRVWSRSRSRSAENIYREILLRLEQYPELEQFEVCDPALNQDLDMLERLCDLIIADGLALRISGMAQINPAMDSRYLKKLKRAGFILLNYGAESGSKKVLKAMGKPYDPDVAERVIKDTYGAGIDVVLNFVVGFPGETDSDFRDTLKFIDRIKKSVSNIAYGHVCSIDESIMEMHPERFNIKIRGESGMKATHAWSTDDNKNTLDVRMKRAEEFDDFIRQLDVPLKCGQDDRGLPGELTVRDPRLKEIYCLRDGGEYEKAVELLEKIIEKEPGLVEAQLLKSEIRILKRENTLKEADRLKSLKKYDAAARSVDRVLAEYPDNVKALIMKGELLIMRDRPGEGMSVLEEALKLDLGEHRAWIYRTVSTGYREEKDLERAEKMIRKSIETAVSREDKGLAYYDLGNLDLLAGRPEAAKDHFHRAVELNPGVSRYGLDIYKTEFEEIDRIRTDEPEKALEILDGILESDPENIKALVLSAEIETVNNNPGRALELLKELEERDDLGEYRSWVMRAHGVALREEGSFVPAQEKLRAADTAAASGIDRGFALCELGDLYLKYGKKKKAAEMYRKAVEYYPDIVRFREAPFKDE